MFSGRNLLSPSRKVTILQVVYQPWEICEKMLERGVDVEWRLGTTQFFLSKSGEYGNMRTNSVVIASFKQLCSGCVKDKKL